MAAPCKTSESQIRSTHKKHNVGKIDQDAHEESAMSDEDDDESSGRVTDCCSDSSESQYPRPRIRQDLLPHDFGEWQKPVALSEAASSSTSTEADSFSETTLSSSTSAASQEEAHFKFFPAPRTALLQGSTRRPPFMDSNALGARPPHKSRQKHQNSTVSRSVNGLPRHGGIADQADTHKLWRNGAADCGTVASAGEKLRERLLDLVASGDGRDVDVKLYQNLVEMFPLVETFMEHPECRPRSNFQRTASMIYTRAPLRDAQVKKVANKVDGGKSSKNEEKANVRDDAVCQWEECENRLRRVEPQESSWSPRSIEYGHADQIAKLQIQVEDLQRKLSERESMLQCKLAERNGSEKADGNSELMQLERKLKELQCEMVEKELEWESAREKLVQKEDEICTMQRLLQRADGSHTDVRQKSAMKEEEVKALRCEVAALRCQMEVADSMADLLPEQNLSHSRKASCEAVREEQEELEMEEMEAARKMYMAAIIAVKHSPGEECLALVGELRMHLESFLRRSTFQGGVPLCC